MGSKKSSPTPAAAPAPSQEEIAKANVDAQLAAIPKAAQLGYDTLANQNYGLEPTTKLYEDVRRKVFTGETAVRDQLLSNILQNLISPTGITPEQQAGIDTRRGTAQSETVKALRNRANLGGGLFGGNAADTEARTVGNLQGQFAEEDINRQERARLNAIQSALPALQILFPDVNLTPPQFNNPVENPNTAAQNAVATRGQDINYQMQQEQNQAALRSALYQGLGSAAGGFFSGGSLGICWVASEIFGGWVHPKTILARFYISNYSPKWFFNFYAKYGQSIASFISNKPMLKNILKPLFEYFSYKGKEKLNAK